MAEQPESNIDAAKLPAEHQSLRLNIDPVIQSAQDIVAHVETELPAHPGLAKASRGVAAAAMEAKRASRQLGKPLSLHRLPAIFLSVSLCGLVFWVYWHFFYTPNLVVAVSARDAVELKQMLDRRVRVLPEETEGSRESIEKLQSQEVDLAFIQGGIEFPDRFPHVVLEQSELVLFFLREGIEGPSQIRRIFTSSEGQGSHTLCGIFTEVWDIQDRVTYLHDWRMFTDIDDYEIPPDVDAVFVVKDPLSRSIEDTAVHLRNEGFRLASPNIGAMSLRLDYLKEQEIQPGYLDPVANIPARSVKTYSVSTFLVARDGLNSAQLAAAGHLVEQAKGFPEVFEPTLDTANDVVQGVEAVLGIVVYIGLAFLALLGLDAIAYRKRFNELNSLVSLISMHQSSKDVLGSPADLQKRHLRYLATCSDLLGLISVITGYYTQENSSLMYNRLPEIIHDRCDGLKINIQLKILHATIQLPEQPSTPSDGPSKPRRVEGSSDD